MALPFSVFSGEPPQSRTQRKIFSLVRSNHHVGWLKTRRSLRPRSRYIMPWILNLPRSGFVQRIWIRSCAATILSEVEQARNSEIQRPTARNIQPDFTVAARIHCGGQMACRHERHMILALRPLVSIRAQPLPGRPVFSAIGIGLDQAIGSNLSIDLLRPFLIGSTTIVCHIAQPARRMMFNTLLATWAENGGLFGSLLG